MTVVKCDKHPADYCATFEIRDYGFLFKLALGAYALRE